MHAKRNAIATTIWRWSQEQKCYYREQESKAAGEEDNPTDSKRNPKPPVFACVPLFVCGCARVRVTLFAGEQEKKQSEEEEEEARTEQGPPFAHLPPEESRASPESLYCLASDSPTPWTPNVCMQRAARDCSKEAIRICKEVSKTVWVTVDGLLALQPGSTFDCFFFFFFFSWQETSADWMLRGGDSFGSLEEDKKKHELLRERVCIQYHCTLLFWNGSPQMEEGLQHVTSARRIRSRKSKQLGETALKKLHKKLSKLCIRTLHLSLSLMNKSMQICNVHLLHLMAITIDLFFFPQLTWTSVFSDDHFVHRIGQLSCKFVQRRLLFVSSKRQKRCAQRFRNYMTIDIIFHS